MSEAYECDRCGSLHEGTPDTTLIVDDGYQRTGKQDRTEHDYVAHTELEDVSRDLCPACRNDLRRWYSEPQGADSDNPVATLKGND